MLTTGEVAKLFHVSAQTVINWLDQGRMPYERIGRGPRRLTEEAVMRMATTGSTHSDRCAARRWSAGRCPTRC